MTTRKYGWRPDTPDPRDLRMAAAPPRKLPEAIDLRPYAPPQVYDQGPLGSCTSQAIAAADEYAQRHAHGGGSSRLPSRLFIYYAEREAEGTVQADAGAMIRTGFKVLAKHGAPPEEPHWPYHPEHFAQRPPKHCWTVASKWQALEYRRVQENLRAVRSCLADGWPVVFGFTVYPGLETEETAQTGRLPMPNLWDERPLGGHAVVAVGYDDAGRALLVRNSWGQDWGIGGHFWMPYQYVEDELCSDFWTLRRVEGGR